MDIGALQAVRTIVAHGGGCPDGIASALIARDVLSAAKVLFVNYETEEHKTLPAEPGLLFVDFSPHRSRVDEFVQAGAIVLDHHKHAKDIVDKFGDRGVFADEETEPGVSGAVLAFRHVWLPLAPSVYAGNFSVEENQVHHFAKLAGIRDTWQKNDMRWRHACAQAEVLRFFPIETWLEKGDMFQHAGWLDEKMRLGEVLLQKKDERTKKILASAFSFKSDRGTHCLIVPTCETSDAAEAMKDADVLIGFNYDCENGDLKLRLSLRSRGGYDVGAFCKRNGGGGHKAAAGCSFNHGAWDSDDPYTFIMHQLNRYEMPDEQGK